MNQPPLLLRYLKILRTRVKLLLLMAVSAALVVGIITLNKERTYTARVTFLTSVVGQSTTISSLKIALGTSGSGVSPQVIYHLIKSDRMAKGIVERFRGDSRFKIARDLTVKRVRRMLDAYEVSQGILMGIEVTSTDPKFSKEVTNFCVTYLNTINEQMALTTDKPMVKMLDPAEVPTVPNPRNTLPKSMAAALITGLLGCLFFVLIDYFKMLKMSGEPLAGVRVPDAENFIAGKSHSLSDPKKY